MLQKLIEFFFIFIYFPIKRLYNFYIKGEYLEDNMRTDAMFEYFTKVVNDPSYQPQGAYEQSFEDELLEAHNTVMERIHSGDFEDIPEDIEMDYASARADYAAIILWNLNEKYILKEE